MGRFGRSDHDLGFQLGRLLDGIVAVCFPSDPVAYFRSQQGFKPRHGIASSQDGQQVEPVSESDYPHL
jgi:hypothetical protein